MIQLLIVAAVVTISALLAVFYIIRIIVNAGKKGTTQCSCCPENKTCTYKR